MKVLVTGGAGYIGSVCVEALANQNHQVLVIDNLSEGHPSAVDRRARLHVVCLSDRDEIRRAMREFQPEGVIHFASLALVGESMKDPGGYFRNNVAHGLNLLDACVEVGVRKLVFSSTCATYGIPKQSPIREDQPQNPINPYGQSKLMFERMLHWYHQIHGLEFVAFRYFNAAGASERFGEDHQRETHLIPNLFKVALKQRENCPIFGTNYPTPDGTCIRDYIHVRDLAAVHVQAIERRPIGFYNLGVGRGYSVRQVLQACERVTGLSIPSVERPRRAGDPPVLVAAADRVRRDFDWRPRFDGIEGIVASAWHWHRTHPNGYRE